MTPKYNALVLDDEYDARKLIKEYCHLYAPIIGICFEARSIEEAINIIETEQISLIFLDIKLKDKSGFDLLHLIHKNQPGIVFTTAYQQYAVRAFRSAALDYLLKPIIPDEFKQAITKFINQKTLTIDDLRLNILFQHINEPGNEVNKISIPVKDGFIFEPINQIIFLKGESNYSRIQTIRGENYLVASTLKYFEEILPESFHRIHKSYLVNLKYVSSYSKLNDTINIADKYELPVSIREKGKLIDAFLK